MKITPSQYAESLFDALSQTSPKDHDKILDNFVRILGQNGDLAKYEEIEEAYKILEMKEKGIKQAEVTVAQDMEINHQIIEDLNKIAQSKLKIKKKVDESIIGGIVMRVDDALLDASVKTQLKKLNDKLKF
jgi:F-type H+-transporting ATPase subunit delta